MGHSVKGAFQCKCPDTYQAAVSEAWSIGAFVRPDTQTAVSPTPIIEFIVDADDEQKLLDKLNSLNKVPENTRTGEPALAGEVNPSTNESFGVGLVSKSEGPTV